MLRPTPWMRSACNTVLGCSLKTLSQAARERPGCPHRSFKLIALGVLIIMQELLSPIFSRIHDSNLTKYY